MISARSYSNNNNSIKTAILREQIQHANTEMEELKNELNKLKIELNRDIKNYSKNINTNTEKM